MTRSASAAGVPKPSSTLLASEIDSDLTRSFLRSCFSASSRDGPTAPSPSAAPSVRPSPRLSSPPADRRPSGTTSSSHVERQTAVRGASGSASGSAPGRAPKSGMTGARPSPGSEAARGSPPSVTSVPTVIDHRSGRTALRELVFAGSLGAARHADAELLLDLRLDLGRDIRLLEEEVARVLLALAELLAVVGVPGARLLDDAVLDAEVDETPLAGDAHAVEDVELGLLERRRHLVLDDLHARAVADSLRA